MVLTQLGKASLVRLGDIPADFGLPVFDYLLDCPCWPVGKSSIARYSASSKDRNLRRVEIANG